MSFLLRVLRYNSCTAALLVLQIHYICVHGMAAAATTVMKTQWKEAEQIWEDPERTMIFPEVQEESNLSELKPCQWLQVSTERGCLHFHLFMLPYSLEGLNINRYFLSFIGVYECSVSHSWCQLGAAHWGKGMRAVLQRKRGEMVLPSSGWASFNRRDTRHRLLFKSIK